MWNKDVAHLLVCLAGRCLVETPISGPFPLGIRQHNLIMYFYVFKLTHDPWYTINRPQHRSMKTGGGPKEVTDHLSWQ